MKIQKKVLDIESSVYKNIVMPKYIFFKSKQHDGNLWEKFWKALKKVLCMYEN